MRPLYELIAAKYAEPPVHTYSFKLKSGHHDRAIEKYSDFIDEVRTIFSTSKHETFDVKLIFNGIENDWITFKTSDLYTRKVQGKILTEDQNKYDDNNITLDIDAFMRSAAKLSNGDFTKDDIKCIAFLVSEAARFELVEHACFVLLNKQDHQLFWRVWSGLLQSWSRLSALGHEHVTIPKKTLIVPISIKNSQGNLYDPNIKEDKECRYVTQAIMDLHEEIEKIHQEMEIAQPHVNYKMK